MYLCPSFHIHTAQQPPGSISRGGEASARLDGCWCLRFRPTSTGQRWPVRRTTPDAEVGVEGSDKVPTEANKRRGEGRYGTEYIQYTTVLSGQYIMITDYLVRACNKRAKSPDE